MTTYPVFGSYVAIQRHRNPKEGGFIAIARTRIDAIIKCITLATTAYATR